MTSFLHRLTERNSLRHSEGLRSDQHASLRDSGSGHPASPRSTCLKGFGPYQVQIMIRPHRVGG